MHHDTYSNSESVAFSNFRNGKEVKYLNIFTEYLTIVIVK